MDKKLFQIHQPSCKFTQDTTKLICFTDPYNPYQKETSDEFHCTGSNFSCYYIQLNLLRNSQDYFFSATGLVCFSMSLIHWSKGSLELIKPAQNFNFIHYKQIIALQKSAPSAYLKGITGWIWLYYLSRRFTFFLPAAFRISPVLLQFLLLIRSLHTRHCLLRHRWPN